MSIDEYILPAETTLFYPLSALNRSNVYSSPLDFHPERWTSENPPTSNTSYCPFGFGVRSCPGEKVAWMEMRIMMAKFLQHYSFSRTTSTPITAKYQFAMRLHPELYLRLQPRT